MHVEGVSVHLAEAIADAQEVLAVFPRDQEIKSEAFKEYLKERSAINATLQPLAERLVLYSTGEDGVKRVYVPATPEGLAIRAQLVALAHKESHFHAKRNHQSLLDAHQHGEGL